MGDRNSPSDQLSGGLNDLLTPSFDSRPLRIAIIYDCLYPHSIGGAERWYRSLAGRLRLRHKITYLTRTQWRSPMALDAPDGVEVIGLGAAAPLYNDAGRRRIDVPLRFAARVFMHLLRNRASYDVIHTCSFPYFPMIAASIVRKLGGPPIVVDWFEVWPRNYWRRYLGGNRGSIAALIQRLCITLTNSAITFSQANAKQLQSNGYRGQLDILQGMYDAPLDLGEPNPIRQPQIVFVGRHISEKNVRAIPAAIAATLEAIPDLKCVIFGDGPERSNVIEAIRTAGLQQHIECPGFVPWETVDQALREAMCLLLPSEREGYGLAVIEAAARGTPSVVVRAGNNAATELIREGVNGYIAENSSPI
ncbi:MAG TPA: glycosyltransferase family 4 protein, partial [Burkholderiaceae bacterium]|nr:glycosyltransferase family 4 protein [Burkholderiaceae bacterium]